LDYVNRQMDELNLMIGDKNFEIEQLNNDLKARNLQIHKQDERII